MSYYNRNNPKSAWSFVTETHEEQNRADLLNKKLGEFNNVLFNETQKSRLVESCILKCNSKSDLFAKDDALGNPCINECLNNSLKLMKSLDFIENLEKY